MRIQLAMILFNLLFVSIALAEPYSGTVVCRNTQNPIAYANVGIVGKGIGTVSGTDGWYSLELDPLYDKDIRRSDPLPQNQSG